METVTNLTNAASRAVFGTPATTTKSNGEPVSGQLGNVKAGEPYDKGNIENEAGVAPGEEKIEKEPVSGVKGDVTSGEPFDGGNKAAQAEMTSAITREQWGSSKENKNAVSGNAQSEPETLDKKFDSATSGMAAMKLPKDGVKSEEKGMGEQYVKSTGVAAKGRNFDASKPGAGKEDDRLLADSGIDHRRGDTSTKDAGLEQRSEGTKAGDTSSSGGPVTSEDSNTSTEVKEKLSLKDKIKAKLHKHKD
ncbi:hypothetical protein BJ878DRAFT_541197 [Calycina marina]|uniref:Uncharacterized protein n=1 Tax=Calycina marina TaxID=1763456 RepID=A0A9P7Z5I0_9HELO|nr:hypothetical protein BJ878DRAFT_541197 [Calycina marina]